MTKPFAQRPHKFNRPFSGRIQPRFSGTDIEQKLALLLGQLPVTTVPQFRIPGMPVPYGNHAFDFGIPSRKLVLEADGCYSHGCARCYPGAKPRERDSRIVAAAQSHGWRVLRFWGHELERDGMAVLAALREQLKP